MEKKINKITLEFAFECRQDTGRMLEVTSAAAPQAYVNGEKALNPAVRDADGKLLPVFPPEFDNLSDFDCWTHCAADLAVEGAAKALVMYLDKLASKSKDADEIMSRLMDLFKGGLPDVDVRARVLTPEELLATLKGLGVPSKEPEPEPEMPTKEDDGDYGKLV